jgi:hypothetical protein
LAYFLSVLAVAKALPAVANFREPATGGVRRTPLLRGGVVKGKNEGRGFSLAHAPRECAASLASADRPLVAF